MPKRPLLHFGSQIGRKTKFGKLLKVISMVEVCAQVGICVPKEESDGLLADVRSIMAGKGEQVALELHAHVAIAIEFFVLIEEKGVAFDVGENGAIALEAELEEDFLGARWLREE